MKKIAEDQKGNFDNDVLETIRNNFYVDDCLKSVSTMERAIKLASDLSVACKTGRFHLTKWTSNSQSIRVHSRE